uniref:Uncharacterized protein n=1 Tax=Solanum tuberosum TaxID=4113 RepID=M1D475_SOLTU
MELKAFLLIVLAILLVITSEVEARKLLQSSTTPSGNGGLGDLIRGLPIVGPILGGLF